MAHVEVAAAAGEFRIERVQRSDYRFEARFDDPGVPGITMLDRILAQFEEFCVVTQSVRLAFPVDVRVLDTTDAVLHSS